MIQSEEFQIWDSENRDNQLFLSDPARAERIYDAVGDGYAGSTHYEIIADWREFLDRLSIFDPEYDDIEELPKKDLMPEVYELISNEIRACEEYLEKDGTLYRQLG